MAASVAQSNDGPVNVPALAALRPGMPIAKIQDAMGARWRAPAPHKGGVVDVLENSHGIRIRIATDGRIGMVDYDHRFSQPIEGLRMGMPLKAAEAALPDLRIGPDLAMMPGVRFGVKIFPDGVGLNVKFTLETVNGITFSNPAATYPPPQPPSYPAASGLPGAPFADANFKLAVLSSLLDAKIIDLGTPQQFAAHVLGRPVDLEDEGYDLIPEALDYLARYPLTDDLLVEVRDLQFDGGATVYRFAWYFWDGEDETFTIYDLSGIALCPNLTSLRAGAMVDAIDIRRLIPLRKLEHLSFDTDIIDNLGALLELPALRQIGIMSDRIYGEVTTPGHPTRQVFDALKGRGIRVWVHWTTHSGPSQPPAFE